jgi:hypothetical protein
MICQHCGATNADEALFCQKCGKRLAMVDEDKSTLYSPLPASSYEEPPYSHYNLSEPIYPPPPPALPYGSAFTPYQETVAPRSHTNRIYLSIITILVIMLVGAGVFVGIVLGKANSPGNRTAKNSNAPTGTTPTSAPHDTLLYAADWSNGLNGWVGTSDWKVRNGILLDDGSYSPSGPSGPTIVAPFQPATADYAVEVRIQFVKGCCFDAVTFRGSQGTDGWHRYKLTILGGYIAISRDDGRMIAITPFDPGNSWHVYRVEAKGSQIKAFVDGGLVLEGNDSRYLSPGQVGIKCSAQLIVSSFKIFAL